SAKADYAIRAAVELAASGDGPVKGDRVAQAQEIPPNFLENIFGDLRNAGLVASRRGADGGYWLARPAEEISLADVIRAVDGPLISRPLPGSPNRDPATRTWFANCGPRRRSRGSGARRRSARAPARAGPPGHG